MPLKFVGFIIVVSVENHSNCKVQCKAVAHLGHDMDDLEFELRLWVDPGKCICIPQPDVMYYASGKFTIDIGGNLIAEATRLMPMEHGIVDPVELRVFGQGNVLEFQADSMVLSVETFACSMKGETKAKIVFNEKQYANTVKSLKNGASIEFDGDLTNYAAETRILSVKNTEISFCVRNSKTPPSPVTSPTTPGKSRFRKRSEVTPSDNNIVKEESMDDVNISSKCKRVKK